MGRRTTPLAVFCLLAAAVALTGCSNSDEGGAAERASHFYRALASKDGVSACADLAREARRALEQEEDESCADAILDQGLPAPAGSGNVQIYASAAQVRHSGETAFLSRYRTGWRITAVGCKSTGRDKPYDCTVEVG